ncbi:MAG: type I polyketide synthase, partial [Chloroflexota bacterium]
MASSEQPQDYRAVMKNALQQIRELKAELAKAQQHRQDPIAIIGIGCRFPTASSTKSIRTPEQFWAFLRDGGDAVSEVPPDRWDVDAYYDPDPATPGKSHIWHGAFLTEVDAFEPQFFNLSPREAITIDPQQRLLLEVSWEALERAGIVPSTLVESQTGVFMGISGSDYGSILVQNGINDNLYGRTGVDISVATGRISYALGLTGPCVAIDTACSSSLVAIHQACQSLHQQECDLALAGGVGLILSPENTIGFSKAGMLSQDGQCKTFDAAANGYVRGEGCGTVVLKRLSDAVADDDQILAVIRGSMVNHDGPSSGLTAPRGPSQQTVIRQALKQANIDPENVSYIEAHGTGTPLGDPIEIGALGAVFRNRSEPLWVGSIKTNLGHLEAAAGIAGLIKIILMLEHEQIPPHLHFQTPNPQIDWAQSPVQIPTVLTNWTMPETAATAATNSERVAGVSSFGFSGTNAHVILSSPPEGTQPAPEPILDRPEASAERSMHLLTLAAKSEPALIGLVKAYQASLEQASEDQDVLNLANICYSAHTSRSHFAHRLGIVASSIEALQETLAQIERGETSTGVVDGHAELDQAQPKVGFLFTGQGSQYVEMGRELYETEPTFRATLEQCDEILKDHLGESLLAILYPGKWASGQVASGEDPATLQPAYLLSQTQYTQPALFVLEVALAQLWHSWGIQPDILMGHSVGEIAAACFAGLFSLEDGLKLIAARGKLMAALPQDGTMVSFMASEEQVQEAIAPYEAEVSIAAINGPESTVISGRRESVLEIAEQMAAQGIKTRELTVSHAFHSPLMEPMLDDFRQVAQSITYHEPKPSLVSNVSGKLASNEVMTADYWVRHVRQAVRFADGVETLHEQGIEIFLEIGPQPILLGMVGDQTTRRPDDQDSPPHPSPKLVIGDTPSPIPEISNQGHPLTLPSLRQNQNDWQQMLSSLGQLYVRGVEIDWEGFDQAYQRQKIVLPTYPFQRQRYWVDTSRSLRREEVLSPLIDKMVKLPTSGETVFETAMSMETFPFLNDHRVYETIVSPGACHLTMVLSAAELTFAQKAESALIYTLADVILPQALALDDDEVRTAQIIYQASEANGAGPAVGFQLISFDEASEETDLSSEVHATGIVGMVSTDSPYQASLKELQIRCSESVNLDLYADGNSPWGKKESSIYFGPSFRWIGEIWRSSENGNGQPTEFLAALYQPDVIASLNGYVIHPGLLDGCFQVAGLAQEWATKQESSQTSETLLPFALERSYFHPSLYSHSTGDTWWCHVEQIEEAKCNIRLFDSLGQIVAELDGFEMRAAPQASIQTTRMRTEWLYTLAWEAMPVPALPEKVEMPDCWLLVGSAEGLSSELLSLLSSDEIAVIRAWDDASIRQTVADLASTYSRIGVVYLDINGKYIDEGVAQHAYQLCSTLLHLTQALIETDLSAHLWIVTQGCQSVEALPRPIRSQEDEKNIPHFDVAAAGALWGLGRTIAQEQPQLQTVCIDLDRDADESQQAELLTKEILVGLDKSEV